MRVKKRRKKNCGIVGFGPKTRNRAAGNSCILSLYPLLALNHLLAHCPCKLNSGLNIFKNFAKSQGDPIEYDYKNPILFILSGW